MNNLCVGLFGTCGNSTWRREFIQMYDLLGIPFFNPQVDDWNPEFAKLEADHLKNDQIILFPVTKDTYGTGSLAETGYSIIQALENTNRFVVIYIDKDLDESLKKDAVASKESIRARALVNAHLEKIDHPNVFVVNSLEEMKNLSIDLYKSANLNQSIRAKLKNNEYSKNQDVSDSFSL